ncbi:MULTISPECIES: hypothetical protein [Cyanophyceae]|uniref:Uncharacterized protein n=1 Tax=Leptolyngbya subtilissima DQ-A4 TaxID=2933933 RepID=A0ABV0JZK8_9CYAN|nr:hypothetical protein [Nodosilinea sp. FACHB-141]MBD2112550.1 hypothetical protein [Nodosilinea sp. FACHB-141]
MPDNKSQGVEELRARLLSIVDVIVKYAEQDSEFLTQLDEVLSLGDSGGFGKTSRRRKKIKFNAVDYLSSHSSEQLKNYLLEQDEADLVQIAKQEGLKNLSKKLSKEETVDKIVDYIQKTLYQGSSFLKENSVSVPGNDKEDQFELN